MLPDCERMTCLCGSTAFERLWPKATCTVLALANHLPLLLMACLAPAWWAQQSSAASPLR